MRATASLPEITAEGAERLSERISLRLDAIATNYLAVMPLIREALNRNAWAVLGYASPGAYAKDRFGESLSKLTPEIRRNVVRELSNAGMSTRAIAPVVGVNNATVSRDLAGVADATPDEAQRAPIVGIDGKTYNPVVTIKTKETHSTETVESFDAATGEAVDSPSPVVPHEGVTAWLESDQSLQDRKYVTAFVRAMGISWMEFDPERIGRLATPDVITQIELSVASVNRFAEKVQRSRPALRAL